MQILIKLDKTNTKIIALYFLDLFTSSFIFESYVINNSLANKLINSYFLKRYFKEFLLAIFSIFFLNLKFLR
jgi:hypothetical protein